MSPHIAATRRATARAVWLAKLSEALAIADNLTLELGRDAEHVEAVVALASQVELVRAEIDSLRHASLMPLDETLPKWTF
ncbi:MAG TPA: hypothetical protein VNI79_01605 [Sphingomicrobium sp.]|nr:hypothetical protein [Sphingomicrobium sp.]